MQKVLVLLCLFGGAFACTDTENPKLYGMWKLTDVVNNGAASKVDTIFFSFHKAVFSYTVLNFCPELENTTVVCYGYLDYPDGDKQVKISMDKSAEYNLCVNDFMKYHYVWSNICPCDTVTFDIKTLNAKHMTLELGGTQFNFLKW